MKAAVLWRATRAYSLPASVVPVVLGSALAARGFGGAANGGRFDAGVFCIVIAGAVFAHFGANVLNDYFDFVKGVDTRPEHGSGVITGGQMTSKQALIFGAILLAAALVCGALLLRSRAHVIIPLALIGFGCAVLYPAFLKKYGLGDLLIIIAFGLGLTLGAYAVQIGEFASRQWAIVSVYSVPICLLVDAILHANNIRDTADDRAADVRTLATMLSRKGALIWQRVLLFGPLVFVVVGTAVGFLPVWSLAGIAATPLLVRAYRSGSVEGTAQAHLAFGLLYAASFLLKPVFV